MMRKIIFLFIATIILMSVAYATDGQTLDDMRLTNILQFDKENSLHLGPLFIKLQSQYFYKIYLAILIGIPIIFVVHFLIIGPKEFLNSGAKIYVFSVFKRIIHLFAAISFIVLIPTGVMIEFGNYLGGGTLIEYARHFHGLATILFVVSIIPMFLFWFIDMIPTFDDLKWMLILGGYLSKEIKEIPAGKFNAGQKIWFWIATLGGIIMILTGAVMYLQDFDYGIANLFGLSQIDLLRVSAIIHNILAFFVIALFFIHIYMAAIVIKGAIYSMITGYKEEEEIKYLHSTWYKKLKKDKKI
jgi:formate dehydrogenase subunit gamma